MTHKLARAVLLLGVLAVGCGGNSPTAPSDLKSELETGGSTFTISLARFTRDFMPVQQAPGPDGGGPLQGLVELRIAHRGSPAAYTLAVSIYDESGARHPVTAVAHDYDAENNLAQLPTLWNGKVGPGEVRHIELQLSGGPYLAAGTKAFAVIDVSNSSGQAGSLRSPTTTIDRTH